MTQQYLRSCTLSLSGSSSITIPSGGQTDLTVEAAIGASTMQMPNPGRFRVYNPNQQTIAALQNKEYQTATWSAGYQGNTGLVYSGNIKQSLYRHAENIVDSYVEIFCSEHADAYQQARVSSTLAAGWKPQDKVDLALKAMAPFGITGLGLVNVDLSQPAYPRARPFAGMARDLLRQVAHSAGADWCMHRGQVHIVNQNKPLQSDGPVILNSNTGLINFAEQTENGIVARCLINPAIYINTQVKIDESSVVQAEQNNGPYGGPSSTNQNLDKTGRIAADGLYRVAYFEVEASTRAQPWYMILTCLAAGASPNQGQIDSGLTSQFLG